MCQLTEPKINYPISSNVLIEYVKLFAYVIHSGSDFILFSPTPYLGKDSKYPIEESIEIKLNVSINEDTVIQILTKLQLSILDFEDWYVSNL